MTRAVKLALALASLALILSLAVLAYAGTKNAEHVQGIAGVVSRVQASRLDATYQACLLRNEQSRTIIRFVSGVNPSLDAQVRRSFQIEPDCAAYARERVHVAQP